MSIFVVFPLLGFTFFLILVLFTVLFARPLVSLLGPIAFCFAFGLASGLLAAPLDLALGFGVVAL